MNRILIGTAVLAVGFSGMGLAQAESGFKVTGGGQAITDAQVAAGGSSAVRGPGDTYGFNAQDTDGDAGDAAKGQFNSIQRTAGATTAKGQGEHIKGDVNCLVAVGSAGSGMARFGGVVRGTETDADPLLFAVDVTDNGEGNGDDDMIVFRTFNRSEVQDAMQPGEENACDSMPEDQDETTLARGNVQVHEA